jgi:nuclear pore complex protein Nup205
MFETKPPSEDERKELQSGAYFILFKSTQTNLLKPGKAANAPCQWTVGKCRSMVILPYILQCKSSTSSGSSDVQNVILLDSCNSNNPKSSRVKFLEKVVLEHHRRRRDLADCIRFLLEAAEMVGSPGTTVLHARLKLIVKQQLIPSKEGANE